MNSIFPTASRKKVELQNQIDTGVITSYSSLMHLISAYGFELTRNGSNYIGFRDRNGSRARVHFEFSNPTSKSGSSTRPSGPHSTACVDEKQKDRSDVRARKRAASLTKAPGGTIYALLVTTNDGLACYVGQTTNFTSRMAAHIRRSRGDRASGPLFAHARSHGCAVKVVVLEIIPKLEGGTHDFERYHKAEASWFQAAVDAGYQAPGSQGWANFGKSRYSFKYKWPAEGIERVARPIDDVVRELTPASDLLVSERCPPAHYKCADGRAV